MLSRIILVCACLDATCAHRTCELLKGAACQKTDKRVLAGSPEECCSECSLTPGCHTFTYEHGNCSFYFGDAVEGIGWCDFSTDESHADAVSGRPANLHYDASPCVDIDTSPSNACYEASYDFCCDFCSDTIGCTQVIYAQHADGDNCWVGSAYDDALDECPGGSNASCQCGTVRQNVTSRCGPRTESICHGKTLEKVIMHPDYPDWDQEAVLEICCSRCTQMAACKHWTWFSDTQSCYLMASCDYMEDSSMAISAKAGSCTEEGSDPFATGVEVSCCHGLLEWSTSATCCHSENDTCLPPGPHPVNPNTPKPNAPLIEGIAAVSVLVLAATVLIVSFRKRLCKKSYVKSQDPLIIKVDGQDVTNLADRLNPGLANTNERLVTTGMRIGFRANDDCRDATDTAYRPMPRLADDASGPPAGDVTVCLRQMMQLSQFSGRTAKHVEVLIEEGWRVSNNRIANGLLDRHQLLTKSGAFTVAVFTIELRNIVLASATLEDEFYYQFSQLFRFRRPGDMQIMAVFVQHFLWGLRAMPKFNGTLWRGIAGEFADAVIQQYTLHSILCWNAPSSATPDRDVAGHFTGSTGIIIKIVDVKNCAHDIREISAFGESENERTILPGSKFVVIKEAHTVADGATEIHVAEVPTEHKH